jgi:hypothetical protein
MKWPLTKGTPNNMILSAIPCLRAEMPDYGMQACDQAAKK